MKTKTKSKQKKGFDPKQYYASLHLGQMFEEFAFATNKNGTLKYATVHQFCRKYAKTDNQYQVLWWLLGPKTSDIDPEFQQPQFELPQFDWMSRRENGHWSSSKNLHNLKKQVESQNSIMGKLKATGTVNINTLELLVKLQEQLNREFGGQLFLADAEFKENAQRAKLFLDLQTQIAQLQGEVQRQFAKVHGFDVDNISAFMALFGMNMQSEMIGARTVESSDPKETAKKAVVSQFMDMVMQKTVNYRLEPPDKLVDEMRVHHEDEEPVHARKKRVQ